VKRPLFILIILLVAGSYLFALIWTGIDFASYASARNRLFLDAQEPRPLALDELATVDLTGGGFNADTRVYVQLDVNNRDAFVGFQPIDKTLFDMERVGNLLYLAGSVFGIRVLDVSLPRRPKMLPFRYLTGASVLDIERSGGKLYLSCGPLGVKIYQLGDQGKLMRMKSLYSWSSAIASKVVGHYLYVVSGTGGLMVYDLNNLGQGKPVAFIESEQPIRRVEAYGGYLYAVAGKGGVEIYQIGDSGVPVLTGQLSVDRSARSITIADRFLYVLENGRISQYDLTDPQVPQLVAEQRYFTLPQKLFHAGDTIYVADNMNGLGLIDNEDKRLPPSAAFLNVGGTPRAIASVGKYLYVSVANKGIRIIDPEAILPRQVVQEVRAPKGFDDFIIIGDSLYVTGHRDGIYRKNLLEKGSPLTRISSHGSLSFTRVGDLLYAAGRLGGVEVFNVSVPEHPEKVAVWPTLKSINIAVDGNHLVAARVGGGLALVDISNPAAPQITDRISGSDVLKTFVRDKLVIIAEKMTGLRLFRIEDGRLVLLSLVKLHFPLDQFSSPISFQVVDDIVYVANGEAGLMIVDIKHPEKPEVLSSLRLPGFANAVLVNGEKVYVTCLFSGLYTIDVRDLHSPREYD